MTIKVEIICDSIGYTEKRLTTFLLTYPRFIHSEIMTHRVFSRNASSSRAIPAERMIRTVLDNPAMPVVWTTTNAGMQGGPPLMGEERTWAQQVWNDALGDAVKRARELLDAGIHKSIANRLLEPFAHMTTLVTATEWDNFFALRINTQAQPEFHALAWDMGAAYLQNRPTFIDRKEWHIPFIKEEERDLPIETRLKIGTARCARTSYINFYGQNNVAADEVLHDRLKENGHWSPFEHLARPGEKESNLRGWIQYRKSFYGENIANIDLRALLAAQPRPGDA